MIVQTAWGGVLPAYLFLGGLGGAVLALCSLLDLSRGKRGRKAMRWSAWSSFAFLAAGAALLLADVGVPLRALVLWKSFVNAGSWLTVGAWVLAAALACSFSYALLVQSAPRRSALRRILAGACLLLGLATCAYTGVLLMASSAVPAWGTWILPALFVASSLSSGVAYASAVHRFREKPNRAKRMHGWNVATVVAASVEGSALSLYVLWLLTASERTAPSAAMLVGGAYAVPFWCLAVVCGIALPWLLAVVALVRRSEPKLAVAASSASALAGGVALRFLVLGVGMHAPVVLL